MTSDKMPVLCETCRKHATRISIRLCADCGKTHRVIALPNEVRTWAEVDGDANSADGVSSAEYINGLLGRVFNQQRELAKLNTIIRELKGKRHGADSPRA